jgi:hypothetical protein
MCIKTSPDESFLAYFGDKANQDFSGLDMLNF